MARRSDLDVVHDSLNLPHTVLLLEDFLQLSLARILKHSLLICPSGREGPSVAKGIYLEIQNYWLKFSITTQYVALLIFFLLFCSLWAPTYSLTVRAKGNTWIHLPKNFQCILHCCVNSVILNFCSSTILFFFQKQTKPCKLVHQLKLWSGQENFIKTPNISSPHIHSRTFFKWHEIT